MPRQHQFQHVRYLGPTRPSARLLDRKLIELGYSGPEVLWGYAPFSKRAALVRMRQSGVPVPRNIEWHSGETPAVCRTDHHRAGSGLWFARNAAELSMARSEGATHAMEAILGAREFRVHVVHGKSIKLTEKVWAGEGHAPFSDEEGIWLNVRTHADGYHQLAPRAGAHRVSLRRAAKSAVVALGLEFGAVDILLKNGQVYVLEVNSAPALTDPNTDTCERYARAFINAAVAAGSE